MCGIAGLIQCNEGSILVEQQLLENMQRVMQHRGPDGYKSWIADDKTAGLIHRRLSIIDLSQAGFQPMSDINKTIFVCCNGEIYNHHALRKELQSYGYCFSSCCDTEVALYAYKHWGISMLAKLEGDFALVIIDILKKESYLIRDRIGVKPLYFSAKNGMLSFASEIKALWGLPWIERHINQQALYHYLTYLSTPAPLTLYKDIYKLPAGFYLKVDNKKNISFCEWYNPAQESDKKYTSLGVNVSEIVHKENILQLLRKSVQKRLMADVPLGVFLSGGLDSSLIVALMAEVTQDIKTFNVSFADGQEYSEIDWARKISKQFNTKHHELVIDEKDAFNFFESMVYHQDEPLADCVCIPLYYIAKLVRDSGVRVALVGEGSDELFCGYASYVQYISFYERYWKQSQSYLPQFFRKSLYSFACCALPKNNTKLSLLQNWAEGKNFFWSGAVAFSELWKKEIVQQAHHCTIDPMVCKIYSSLNQEFDSHCFVAYHLSQLSSHMPNADFLTSMLYLEFKQRLPELLLMRVDKMTMATSIEARVPFLDHELVEYGFSLPTCLKYNKGVTKYILKKIAQDFLPHDLVYRPKMGFAAPTMQWFKKGKYFKPYLRDLISTRKGIWQDYLNLDAIETILNNNEDSRLDHSVQLWTLQNLLACVVV